MKAIFHLCIILFQAFFEISCDEADINWEKFKPPIVPKLEKEGPPIECKSKECERFVELFEADIDPLVPKCEDFYKHACHNWQTHNVLDGRLVIDKYTEVASDILEKIKNVLTEKKHKRERSSLTKAKTFWNICMDEAVEEKGRATLISFISLAGGSTLFRNVHDERSASGWLKAHEFYFFEADIPALYDISIGINRDEPKKRIITVSPPATTQDDTGLLATRRKRRDVDSNKLYKDYIVNVVTTLFGDDVIHGYTKTDFYNTVDNMMNFEKELLKLTDADEEHDSTNVDDYRIMTIEELQTKWESATSGNLHYDINWFEIMKNLTKNIPILRDMDKKEKVALTSERYIEDLSRLLLRTNPETIVNYIQWNGIHRLLKYGDENMRKLRENYLYGPFRDPSEKQSEVDRWITCAADFPLEYALYEKINPKLDAHITSEQILTMDYAIRYEFAKSINKTTWLNFGDMNKIIQKIKKITDSNGYPTYFNNFKRVDDYYRKLEFTPNVGYLWNAAKVDAYKRMKRVEKLRHKITNVDQEEWRTSSLVGTANYDEELNRITIPRGELLHPSISTKTIPVVRWATLGFAIGHEIAHSIGNVGRFWSPDRYKKQWWTDRSIFWYTNYTGCYLKRYDNYSIESLRGTVKIPVDNKITLEENIADDLGVRMAFRAFQAFDNYNKTTYTLEGLTTNYTNEQLFFYSFAQSYCENVNDKYLENNYAKDSHPPWRVRVNSVLATMQEFTDAFGCKEGEAMMQVKNRCKMWP